LINYPATIDNKVLPLKLQGFFWGPGFQIDWISFLKCAFTKKPRFYRTGSWGPGCEILLKALLIKFRVCPSCATIDNKVLPLKPQGFFWGPGFQIDWLSFLKCAFTKKPSFFQTGGWGPGCEID